jgi:hypothetical protein
MEYADRNAEANTDYLIRVEQDEPSLPRFVISANGQENVTMRLRGYQEERTLKNMNQAQVEGNVSYDSEFMAPNGGLDYTGQAAMYSFFDIGYAYKSALLRNKIAFILENNITVKGTGQETSKLHRNLFTVYYNVTLVMKKGSKLTEYNYSTSVIEVKNQGLPAAQNKHGMLRIEGGSITNCSFTDNTAGLVFFQYGRSIFVPGSLYKAASTTENPIDLKTGNTNSLARWVNYTVENTNNLAVDEEISLPQ